MEYGTVGGWAVNGLVVTSVVIEWSFSVYARCEWCDTRANGVWDVRPMWQRYAMDDSPMYVCT